MQNKSMRENAFYNTIKQICTGLFPIITIPYTTRILGTENYGRVNFCISIISYFVLFAGLGIATYATRQSAILKNNKKDLDKFTSQLFTTHIIMSIIALLLLFFLLLISKGLYQYSILLIVQSFMIIFNIFNIEWIYNAFEDYKYTTICTIIVQIISLIFLFTFVREPSDYIIYSIIYVISYSGMYLLSFFNVKKYTKVKITKHPNAIKHILPMLILFSNELMVTIYVNSDITLLGILSNDENVGIYSVAVKAYTVFKRMFGAVIVVMLPRLSYYYIYDKKGKYNELLRKAFNCIILLIFPVSIGMLFISDELMLLLGGKEYLVGSNSLRVLSIALIFSTIANFYATSVMLPSKQEKRLLLITVISAVVNIGLNLIFIPKLGFLATALTTMIAEIIVAILSTLYSKKLFVPKIKLDFLIDILIGIVAIIIICLFIEQFEFNYILKLILKVFLSVLMYTTVLLIRKNEIVINIFKKKR